MAIFLEPNERVLQTIDCVWYSTVEKAGTYWKLWPHSDEGTLRLTNKRLIFEGIKYSISMPEILDIRWRKPKGSTYGEFICVDFKNEGGKLDSALFLHWGKGIGYGVWRIKPAKERTKELFKTIVDWREKYFQKGGGRTPLRPLREKTATAKGETLAYVPIMCPKCRHPNFPGAKYCAECGRRLG